MSDDDLKDENDPDDIIDPDLIDDEDEDDLVEGEEAKPLSTIPKKELGEEEDEDLVDPDDEENMGFDLDEEETF